MPAYPGLGGSRQRRKKQTATATVASIGKRANARLAKDTVLEEETENVKKSGWKERGQQVLSVFEKVNLGPLRLNNAKTYAEVIKNLYEAKRVAAPIFDGDNLAQLFRIIRHVAFSEMWDEHLSDEPVAKVEYNPPLEITQSGHTYGLLNTRNADLEITLFPSDFNSAKYLFTVATHEYVHFAHWRYGNGTGAHHGEEFKNILNAVVTRFYYSCGGTWKQNDFLPDG